MRSEVCIERARKEIYRNDARKKTEHNKKPLVPNCIDYAQNLRAIVFVGVCDSIFFRGSPSVPLGPQTRKNAKKNPKKERLKEDRRNSQVLDRCI
jgi:hypothetical protein